MNQKYSLRELLKFFQRQRHEEYPVIEAIVNLMEYKSKNLPEHKKPQVIVDTLRNHRLYEVGFKGEKTFRDVPKFKLPEEPEKPIGKVDWFGPNLTTQIEQYNIRVLNCYVMFESFMN